LVSRSAQPDAQVAILSFRTDYHERSSTICAGSKPPRDRDNEQIPRDRDLRGVEIGQPLSTTCRSGRDLHLLA